MRFSIIAAAISLASLTCAAVLPRQDDSGNGTLPSGDDPLGLSLSIVLDLTASIESQVDPDALASLDVVDIQIGLGSVTEGVQGAADQIASLMVDIDVSVFTELDLVTVLNLVIGVQNLVYDVQFIIDTVAYDVTPDVLDAIVPDLDALNGTLDPLVEPIMTLVNNLVAYSESDTGSNTDSDTGRLNQISQASSGVQNTRKGIRDHVNAIQGGRNAQ